MVVDYAGGKQAQTVASALRCSKFFEEVKVVPDLAGRERFVTAFRTAVDG